MIRTAILILTSITTALMAGLFFAWSVSVTPGLSRISNTAYIAAFQSMNRAIQNPLFFTCFFGAALLLPLSTYMQYGMGNPLVFWLLLSATLLYLIGVMGITIFGNIPLNESLDTFDLQSSSKDEITTQRTQFQTPWNRLNNIRTVTSTFALACLLTACILY